MKQREGKFNDTDQEKTNSRFILGCRCPTGSFATTPVAGADTQIDNIPEQVWSRSSATEILATYGRALSDQDLQTGTSPENFSPNKATLIGLELTTEGADAANNHSRGVKFLSTLA